MCRDFSPSGGWEKSAGVIMRMRRILFLRAQLAGAVKAAAGAAKPVP